MLGGQLHRFTNTPQSESCSGFEAVGSFHGSMPVVIISNTELCCVADDGSITSLAKTESPPCQQDDDDCQGSKRIRCSWQDLPEVC